jgi:hypothetical protein
MLVSHRIPTFALLLGFALSAAAPVQAQSVAGPKGRAMAKNAFLDSDINVGTGTTYSSESQSAAVYWYSAYSWALYAEQVQVSQQVAQYKIAYNYAYYGYYYNYLATTRVPTGANTVNFQIAYQDAYAAYIDIYQATQGQ